MASEGGVVIIGGNRGIAREIAKHYAGAGREVVITCTHGADAEQAATEIGGQTTGLELNLTHPETIGPALSSVGSVDYLVIAAISRDDNRVREYSFERALELVTMKLVGYTEVVHTLLDRMSDDSAIVLFGGLAKDRPYPGSTTVSTVNAGWSRSPARSPPSWRRSGSMPSIRASWATARTGRTRAWTM
jgi:NAD(P)-dependent dehydrogenase (short-subunit alcohol dehydrogenase family)